MGATLDHLDEFGLGNHIPATAFLDRDGRVIWRIRGEMRKEEIEHRVEWLLGNHAGPPPEPLLDNLNRK